MGRSRTFLMIVLAGLAFAAIFICLYTINALGQEYIASLALARSDDCFTSKHDHDTDVLAGDAFQAEVLTIKTDVEDRVVKLEHRVRQLLMDNLRLRQSFGIVQQSIHVMAGMAEQVLNQKVITEEVLTTQFGNLTNQTAAPP